MLLIIEKKYNKISTFRITKDDKMKTSAYSVAARRGYSVETVQEAKKIASQYLVNVDNLIVGFGLPEINDRNDTWKVPLLYDNQSVGDLVIDAHTAQIRTDLSSKTENIKKRIEGASKLEQKKIKNNKIKDNYIISSLENTIAKGSAEAVLSYLPPQCIDMIFTSPPYYNAKKEYSEYSSYDDYLSFMRNVIRECGRVLIDGKFFIINSSHILLQRTKRSEASSRIAVPFDLHQIFMEEGFEFVDDIIWQKPEGAGWASGRGRRFSADRNPMQYKAVPVTEYVMVYRKKSDKLIDYFIRNHPNQNIIQESKIPDGYEKTNIWYISPAHSKIHPAIFPQELAKKVIQYYSFKNDVVLDPFGGIGTTAKAAIDLKRRFYSIEINDTYIEETIKDIKSISISLFDKVDFKYEDYSKLKYSSKIKSVYTIISSLLKKGVSSEELYDYLERKYKENL